MLEADGRPASPTNSFQPRARPASTETRALTDGGQDRLAVRGVLLVEPLDARHGDDAGGDALGLQRLAGLDGELHLGSGGDQDDVGVCRPGRLGQDVGALGDPGRKRRCRRRPRRRRGRTPGCSGGSGRCRPGPRGSPGWSSTRCRPRWRRPGGPRPGPGWRAGWRAAPPAGGSGRLRPGRRSRASRRRSTALHERGRGGWPAACSR